MKVKDKPQVYKCVLVLSSIALACMVTFLVFNTYKLKDERFHAFQKESMVSAYGQYVKNEKLFPGGNKLFAEHFEKQLPDLLSIEDQVLFEVTKDSIVSGFLVQLRQHHNFDALFNRILIDQHLDQDFIYKLTFDRMEIIKKPDQGWTTIYQVNVDDPEAGIAGTLRKVSTNNRALQLSINNNQGAEYRFTYSLFVDRPNRVSQVLQDMSLVLFFSAACILLTILINYRTFQNWVNQRKETQLKNDFIQHIRHEFNTPITTIVVAARSLYDMPFATANEKEVKETSAIIERQGMRLRSYVKQILMSITLEEQKPDFILSDSNELTAVLLRDITLRFEDKISITYKKAEKAYPVWVDSLLYLCILDNLVENACKFNKEKNKHVHLFWQVTDANVLQLCIQDNGEGIPRDDMNYIFQKFYRSKKAQSRSGLGLGLYYSYLCASKMNWKIVVAEAPEKGTRMEIIIPTKN